MTDPVRRTVTVDLENGLHLVPCSQIAQAARRHDGEVRVRNGQKAADAKNVLDLMTLRAEFGTQLEIEANGASANEVIEVIVQLFQSKFEGREPATT
ncbi:MAG: HPr family phosphocarrier protein [Planctomycetaceae bacterium]|nr:HPr family phosphocarrier protein [Planctomycetaceae bacterium]